MGQSASSPSAAPPETAGARGDTHARSSGVGVLCRGVLQAYWTSVVPYGVSVSAFVILFAVVPRGIYAILLLWYALLLLLGLLVTAPFFAWPLRHVSIGATFSTLRSLWTCLLIYLAGSVATVVGMWVVTLFYETGGGIVEAARIIGWLALFLFPGAVIAWGLLSLLERSLHRRLARQSHSA